ncbi:MAG: 23S rRNA (guanosine(2251)-2'-O)-methyltransferase RlmB [Deltaproteobacteria bacterium]|nr:23S rRNA (guanosine(2251)-2'-O)-methyltransferase RlmB [Deltaproteobacteria bacterium]
MKPHPKKKDHSCKSRTLYGWHPVHEHLRAQPGSCTEVYLLPSLQGTIIDQLAHEANVPVRYESQAFFEAFAQGGVHQGVAALLRAFPYVSLQSILEQEPDILLVLDNIIDPRNLGALLRTAEGARVGGVILTSARSASLSPLVEKVATGATAYVPICRIENLARTLSTIREQGYWTVGLVPDASMSLYDLPVSRKIALVVGGEEKGVRQLTRQLCDCLVSIPMRGKIASLNVSVAGAIALYELVRRGQSQNEVSS